MNETTVMALVTHAITVGMKVASPILLVSLGVGLLISIFQATTQIQEQTLTFVPKLVCILLVIIIGGAWMLGELKVFTIEMINNISTITESK